MALRALIQLSRLRRAGTTQPGDEEGPAMVSPYLLRPLRELADLCPELMGGRPHPAASATPGET